MAYYVNIILGFDYDSYSLRGGDVYFQKAWNIVNNAPEGREITGWKSFESLRNRYWLAENMNNSRFALALPWVCTSNPSPSFPSNSPR